MLGSVLGEKLGGWLGYIYARWDRKDEQQAVPQPVKAQADMRIALAPGLVLQTAPPPTATPLAYSSMCITATTTVFIEVRR
ncbi:hypothetical protein [Sodalis glossinidius]|uniref:hypothetical protein n=1 Tax=Sodalis glossinidius TaxID=63612 RepID=UPI0003009795|nr:hypothetical protein [Sodalis glossinidius]